MFLVPLILVAAALLYDSLFVVDETQQVVITQFGRIVGAPIKEPGLNFKIPFIQKANFFPKNLLEWDGDPGQVPTKDKTYLWVDTFARWKISDPVVYFQTVKDEFSALKRLDDIIDPATRNLVTSFPLLESVRNSDRPMDTFEYEVDNNAENQQKNRIRYAITLGRDKLTQKIVEQARQKLKKFGIDLVDVKIKRINYIESVRRSVYDRMIAERKQIAEKFRAEGKGEASQIRGEKEKELQVIKSEAYKAAQKIKGDADAAATKIYADAYGSDPDFYAFVKTLEVYKATLGKDTSLVLSTDSDLMKYLKGVSK